MRKLLFYSLFISYTLNSYAQEKLLTIQEAVSSAYNRNTELQQMNAQLRQKKDAWRLETGISAPEISYFKEGISNGPGDIFDEQRITISQSIDFPLTGIYRIKGLGEEVKALEFNLKNREKEIKAEVKSSYIEIIYALRLQESRENKLKLLEGLHKAVATKFENGMANGIDLANADLQVDEARNDLDQARWILHKARYDLFFAMGLPVEQQSYSIQFTDSLYAPDIAIEQIFALAGQENQPSFLAVRHELNAAGYLLKEAKSNLFPDISLNLYRQDYGTGYDFTGFEVGLSIPLWYPFDYKGKISMSMARQEEIRWKQDEIRLDMKRQIEHAWHNYEVSHKIVHRYLESMKSRASQLQTLSLRAYELGEIDLLHLLNAQQTYLQGEERYLAAMRDYYQQLVKLEKFLEEDLVK